MAPKAELSPRAEDDVRDIWRYTAETWSEHRAQTYVDGLFDMMEALAAEPHHGRAADEIAEGLLRRACASHVIFYRAIDGGVLIVRVLHARMDFPAHLANDQA